MMTWMTFAGIWCALNGNGTLAQSSCEVQKHEPVFVYQQGSDNVGVACWDGERAVIVDDADACEGAE